MWMLIELSYKPASLLSYFHLIKSVLIYCFTYYTMFVPCIPSRCTYNLFTDTLQGPGRRFKHVYELVLLGAIQSSILHKLHIFQCIGKIFCVELLRCPLKFHTKYLTHTLQDTISIQCWQFRSSQIYELVRVFDHTTPTPTPPPCKPCVYLLGYNRLCSWFVVLCCASVTVYLTIFFRVTSQTLEQTYDCPCNVNQAIPKNMVKYMTRVHYILISQASLSKWKQIRIVLLSIDVIQNTTRGHYRIANKLI